MITPRLGIRIPLTLAAVTLLVLTVGQSIILWQDLQDEQQTIRQYVQTLARATAEACVDPLLVRDYPQLKHNSQGLLDTRGVAQVQIIRSDDVVLVDTAEDTGLPDDHVIWFDAPIAIHSEIPNQASEQLGVLRIGLDHSIFWQKAMRNVFRDMMQVLALLVLLSLALTWALQRSVVKPIQRVAAFAQRIAQGHLDESFPQTRTDEIGQLEHEIDAMRLSLGSSLRQADTLRQQAENANQAKTQFLANMSHEMRTPLTAVLGFAEQLTLDLADQPMEAERFEHLAAIVANGQHLLHVINDVLDLSKIEAGHSLVNRQQVDTQSCLALLWQTMAPAAKHKGLAFALSCPQPLPATIETDAQRLHQVLVNLVGNAIKFTTKGSVSVDVTCQPMDDGVHHALVVKVSDTGIGIPEHAQARIFEAFNQGDTSMTRPYGGTGLGLAISRQLTVDLGGDLSVVSETGKGTCFEMTINIGQQAPAEFVTLSPEQTTPTSATAALGHPDQLNAMTVAGLAGTRPAALTPTPTPATNTKQHADATDSVNAAPSESKAAAASAAVASSASSCKSTTSTAPTAQSDQAPLEGLRVLLAEDGLDNQRLIALFVRRAGGKIEVVDNGLKACQKIIDEQQPVDVVLMDMQMPVMDGYAATRRLREAGCQMPIVALTAHAMAGAKEQCMEAGCSDFATKPINRQALVALIQHWAEQAQASKPKATSSPNLPASPATNHQHAA